MADQEKAWHRSGFRHSEERAKVTVDEQEVGRLVRGSIYVRRPIDVIAANCEAYNGRRACEQLEIGCIRHESR